jgi:hypothetical protein
MPFKDFFDGLLRFAVRCAYYTRTLPAAISGTP